MGRPKGSRNKQTSDESKEIEREEDTDEAALIAEEKGQNVVALKPAKAAKPSKAEVPQLNDAQVQSLLVQSQGDYNKALGVKNKATKDFLQVCKRIKSECGKDAIDDIKELNLLETEEGEEKIKLRVLRTIRNANYVGAKLGEQLRLFSNADGVPLGMRAYEAGRRAGLAGEKRKSPHSPGGEEDQQFLSGWSDGQTELAQTGFKPFQDSDAAREPSYEVLQ